MNKYYLIVLSLLIFSGCSKKTVEWYSGNLDEALYIAENKIIMIDFYTDW